LSSATQARQHLGEWLSTSPGRLIMEAEARALEAVLPDLFGYYLVQVGALSPVEMLSHTRVLHSVVVDIDGVFEGCPYPVVRGEAGRLPVASESVDVLLLPHVLEYEPQPHEALREAQRVLVPEGSLILSGFNPWSLVGAWRVALGHRGASPWTGRFLGLNRIKDWLSLLAFDVTAIRPYFFRPPLRSERIMGRLRFLEEAGVRAWPYFAGAYLLVARKKVIPVTPIRPRWAARPGLRPVGAAEPTVRAAAA